MTDRSAEELERDAERIRSGIANTAEELKYRMQPGQVVDEMTRYLRDSDSSIALDNLRRQVRDNPMALALIGAGVAWLIFGRGGNNHGAGNGYEEVYGPGAYHGGYDAPGASGYASAGTGVGYIAGADVSGSSGGSSGGFGAKAREAAQRAGEAGRDYANRAREAGRDYSHRAEETAEGVSGRMREFAHDAREFVHDARDRVRDWRSEAGDRVRGLADRAGERWNDVSERGRHWSEHRSHSMRDRGSSLVSTIEREPFLAGAIGLAIGAALGTMLPKARIEEEAWPEARAQVRRGAGHAFDYASDRARHMAQDVYEAGRSAAEREGLVPSGERTMAERVGNVARAAADAAVEDTEHEAQRTREGASGAGTTPGPSNGIPGAGTVRPKTGTDDLSSRAATTERRDIGPGGTGPA